MYLIFLRGSGTLNTDEKTKSDAAKIEIERLRKEEALIDEDLRVAQANLRLLTESDLFARYPFLLFCILFIYLGLNSSLLLL